MSMVKVAFLLSRLNFTKGEFPLYKKNNYKSATIIHQYTYNRNERWNDSSDIILIKEW